MLRRTSSAVAAGVGHRAGPRARGAGPARCPRGRRPDPAAAADAAHRLPASSRHWASSRASWCSRAAMSGRRPVGAPLRGQLRQRRAEGGELGRAGRELVAAVGQRAARQYASSVARSCRTLAQDLVRAGPLGDDRRPVGVGEGRQPDRPLEDVEDHVARAGARWRGPSASSDRRAPSAASRSRWRDEREVVAVAGEVAQLGGHLALAPRMRPGRRQQQARPPTRAVSAAADLQVAGVGRPHQVGVVLRARRRRPASRASRSRARRRCAVSWLRGRSRRAPRRPSPSTAAGSSPRAGPARRPGGRSPRACPGPVAASPGSGTT